MAREDEIVAILVPHDADVAAVETPFEVANRLAPVALLTTLDLAEGVAEVTVLASVGNRRVVLSRIATAIALRKFPDAGVGPIATIVAVPITGLLTGDLTRAIGLPVILGPASIAGVVTATAFPTFLLVAIASAAIVILPGVFAATTAFLSRCGAGQRKHQSQRGHYWRLSAHRPTPLIGPPDRSGKRGPGQRGS